MSDFSAELTEIKRLKFCGKLGDFLISLPVQSLK
jgi:hypothetical protein